MSVNVEKEEEEEGKNYVSSSLSLCSSGSWPSLDCSLKCICPVHEVSKTLGSSPVNHFNDRLLILEQNKYRKHNKEGKDKEWMLSNLPQSEYISGLRVNATEYLTKSQQADGWRSGADRRVYPSGVEVSKTERIKVSEIHSRSMELSFWALASDSCQAAIQSGTQRGRVGPKEDGDRRSSQGEEEKDSAATAMLSGQ